jgi:exonuclease VII large subunit
VNLRLLGLSCVALVLSAPLLVSCSHETAYSTAEAKNHVGEVVSVVGIVEQVTLSRKGTQFLNFDGRYPSAPFTAVVFQPHAAAVGDVKKYEGQKVIVTGKITLYRGTPEIVVESGDALIAE